MTYNVSITTITIFALFVLITLGISWFQSRRVRTAHDFYAAGGKVSSFVNGVALSGDYLSAASFLGICGMIAFFGFDGFLYSIGYLAGWIVALFIIAEPLRRIGKYTFADALNYRFQSRTIRVCAAISALVVSLCYLIPQMVGAGTLVVPLLGLPHWAGVVLVGTLVIVIVSTAGMKSTTYVQFLKGFMLVSGTFVLAIMVLFAGVKDKNEARLSKVAKAETYAERLVQKGVDPEEARQRAEASVLLNNVGGIVPGEEPLATGPIGPLAYIGKVLDSRVEVASPSDTYDGNTFLLPGVKYKHPIDYVSLALALILGTAALPHILIRYYTVPSAADARRSTVVGILFIGTFYILTLYLGLGAIVNGVLDPSDTNMTAPLLAQALGGNIFFATISAVAFTTILGTVAGLVVAASGAVAHDILGAFRKEVSDSTQVLVGKITAVAIGLVAIVLGIMFSHQNVSFLVGLAFAVAASANLPGLVLSLFWSGTTERGVISGLIVGLVSAVLLIAISPTIMGANALFPLTNPGIVSIPLGFLTTSLVSLVDSRKSTVKTVLQMDA